MDARSANVAAARNASSVAPGPSWLGTPHPGLELVRSGSGAANRLVDGTLGLDEGEPPSPGVTLQPFVPNEHPVQPGVQQLQPPYMRQVAVSFQERREVVGIGGRCGQKCRQGEPESDGSVPQPLPPCRR